MSGGSLDYVYSRVQEAAGSVRSMARSPKHRAFADHLVKVAKALHDFEWAASGDSSFEDAEEAIDAVVSPADVLANATAEARRASDDLIRAIMRAR